MAKKSKTKYFAVVRGLEVGIFHTTWSSVAPLVTRFPGALFKAFPTLAQANAYYDAHCPPNAGPGGGSPGGGAGPGAGAGVVDLTLDEIDVDEIETASAASAGSSSSLDPDSNPDDDARSGRSGRQDEEEFLDVASGVLPMPIDDRDGDGDRNVDARTYEAAVAAVTGTVGLWGAVSDLSSSMSSCSDVSDLDLADLDLASILAQAPMVIAEPVVTAPSPPSSPPLHPTRVHAPAPAPALDPALDPATPITAAATAGSGGSSVPYEQINGVVRVLLDTVGYLP